MVETKLAQETDLEGIFNRHISEIHSQNYQFNRIDEEAKFLKTVTKTPFFRRTRTSVQDRFILKLIKYVEIGLHLIFGNY